MVSLLSPSKLVLAALAAAILDVAHAVEFFMPDWVIPQEIGTTYPAMTVNAGDSLTFSWDFGTHDVWIYPSGTCDPTDGIQIGTVADNPTTYTFTEDDAGTTITFACDVGAHCNAGMIMDVVVLSAAGGEDEAVEILEEIIDEGTATPEIFNGDEETSPAEEATVVDVEAGTYEVCYVCGDENGEFTQTGATVSLPPENIGDPPFVVQCGQLYQDGLDGKIPASSCPFINDFAAESCGCINPNFTCNICGEDGEDGPYEIRSPEATVFLPSDPTTAVTCLELAGAGLSGELNPTQCNEAILFGFERCQCTPVDYSCSICGEGYVVNNPDAVVDSPDFEETVTCAELEVLGLSGNLSPLECIAGESYNRITNACGCIPEGGYDECLICGSSDLVPLSPEVNLTLGPFDINTCEFFYEAGKAGELGPGRCFRAEQQQASLACNCAPVDYTCNVCGGDGVNVTMLYPENNFTVFEVGGSIANCGEIDALGMDGLITPFDCSVLSPLAQTQCGCTPIDWTCNICGENPLMTITEADVAFIPGEATTCGEAQEAGMAGQLDPVRCAAITPFAQFSCGCEAGGTVSPVVDEDIPEEIILDEEPEEITLDGADEDVVALSTVAPTGIATSKATEGGAPVDATDALAATDGSSSAPEAESPPAVVEESVPATDTAPVETENMAEETATEDATVSLQPPPESTTSALEAESSAMATVSASIGTMMIGTIAAFFVVV